MEFILGMGIGAIVMWIEGKIIFSQWKQDLEKLKDFDNWKEWKNKTE